MKKAIIIIISVVLAVLIVITVVAKFIHHSFLQINSPIVTDINYNNYFKNRNMYVGLDIKYNHLAFYKQRLLFGPELVIADDKGHRYYRHDIRDKFQLGKDKIVYLDYAYLNNNCLKISDFYKKDGKVIAQRVKDFLYYNDYVIYSVTETDDSDLSFELYLYEVNNDKSTMICREDIQEFYIYNDKLYILDAKKRLSEYSFLNKTNRPIMQLKANLNNEDIIMPQKNNVICALKNQMVFVNTADQTEEVVDVVSDHNVHIANFICNDYEIYCLVSYNYDLFQDVPISEVKNENVGIWSIDPTTKESRQIVSGNFRNLQLFGDLLFYSDGNFVYQVDTNTGEAKMVAW